MEFFLKVDQSCILPGTLDSVTWCDIFEMIAACRNSFFLLRAKLKIGNAWTARGKKLSQRCCTLETWSLRLTSCYSSELSQFWRTYKLNNSCSYLQAMFITLTFLLRESDPHICKGMNEETESAKKRFCDKN